MRRSILVWGAVLLSLAGPAFAAPDKDGGFRRFVPASKWVMDYAEDSCRLTRNFTESGDQIMLVLERFEPGEPLSIALAGTAIKTRLGVSEARIAFAPVSPTLSYPIFKAELADGRAYYYLAASALPRFRRDMSAISARTVAQVEDMPADTIEAARSDEVEQMGGVRELQLLSGFSERISLAVGSLASAAKAIQACTDELVTHWKVDAAAHRTLTRRAYPRDPQKLSAAFSYPAQALAEGRGGMVRYRLMIDAAGAPTSCKIIGPGGLSDLGQTTCVTLMKAGRFSPAKDAKGVPIASFYLGRVRFN